MDSPDLRVDLQALSDSILTRFPDTQALYLFGSAATGELTRNSDIDIAVLLPVVQAGTADRELSLEVKPSLDEIAGRPVDLINLRMVSVVFKKEIIFTGERFFTADITAAEEFEMLTMSYYQKLNDERREILEELFRSKRSYAI
jgi:predicted nucleotidyltransferase